MELSEELSINDILEDAGDVMSDVKVEDKVEEEETETETEEEELEESETEDSEDDDEVEGETEQEAQAKFWDAFESEEEAKAYVIEMQQELQRVRQAQQRPDPAEQQRIQEQRRQQLEHEDRQFVEQYTQLILAGKGDEAALFMRNKNLYDAAQMAEFIVDKKLSQMAQYYEGRNAFLKDEKDADLHPAIGHIEALIRSGLTEAQAKHFLRTAVQAVAPQKGQPKTKADTEKRKQAALKSKRESLAEEPTASRRKPSKDKFDKFADNVIKDFFG